MRLSVCVCVEKFGRFLNFVWRGQGEKCWMEEVGEVARIMSRKYGEQSFKKSDEAADLGDEMADVLFVLICLANQTGIDLTEAMEKNLEKKNIRDADRHRNNEKLSK